MKKLLLSALLAVMAAVPASAGIFKYGVEGGLNLNKIKVDKDAFSSDNRAGWFIGPKLQLNIPGGLMIDGAVQYSQQKMSVDIDDDQMLDGAQCIMSQDKTLQYVVVPLNLKYGIGLGSKASVYISTGPQWNWYVGDTSFKMMTETFDITRNTFCWNFGVGVHLLGHLQVGATYNLNFGKSFAEVKDNAAAQVPELIKNTDWKNNGIQVRLAYMF